MKLQYLVVDEIEGCGFMRDGTVLRQVVYVDVDLPESEVKRRLALELKDEASQNVAWAFTEAVLKAWVLYAQEEHAE